MLENVDPVTAKAIVAVGTEDPTDWSLTPGEHTQSLPPEAAGLCRVLEEPTLRETINTFEASDGAATRARDWYKLLAGWSATLSLFAVIIAAVLLLTAARVFEEWLDLRWIATFQGAFLILSFLLSLLVSWLRPFELWMSARANSEWNRILFFKRVTDARLPTSGTEIPLLPLQLEYFRRYQVDVQKKYYTDRGAQHASAVWRASAIRWSATILVVLAGIPIVATQFDVDVGHWLGLYGLPDWFRDLDFQERLFIALSTTGAALQGWLAATALMNQDARNAARYAATARNLQTLSGRPLDEARVAAAKGDIQDVQSFIDLVQDQVSSEHREWVDLRSLAANGSLESMKEVGLAGRRSENSKN